MRVLVTAFLLLLGNATDGRARTSVQRHDSSRTVIAAASQGALLAATPVPDPKDVDTALGPQLLASEASLPDRRAQSAPAPTRDSASLCSYERATGQAARPPPFQA